MPLPFNLVPSRPIHFLSNGNLMLDLLAYCPIASMKTKNVLRRWHLEIAEQGRKRNLRSDHLQVDFVSQRLGLLKIKSFINPHKHEIHKRVALAIYNRNLDWLLIFISMTTSLLHSRLKWSCFLSLLIQLYQTLGVSITFLNTFYFNLAVMFECLLLLVSNKLDLFKASFWL